MRLLKEKFVSSLCESKFSIWNKPTLSTTLNANIIIIIKICLLPYISKRLFFVCLFCFNFVHHKIFKTDDNIFCFSASLCFSQTESPPSRTNDIRIIGTTLLSSFAWYFFVKHFFCFEINLLFCYKVDEIYLKCITE